MQVQVLSPALRLRRAYGRYSRKPFLFLGAIGENLGKGPRPHCDNVALPKEATNGITGKTQQTYRFVFMHARLASQFHFEYEAPLGWIGRFLGGWLIRRKLDRMFAYRHETTRRMIESGEWKDTQFTTKQSKTVEDR